MLCYAYVMYVLCGLGTTKTLSLWAKEAGLGFWWRVRVRVGKLGSGIRQPGTNERTNEEMNVNRMMLKRYIMMLLR